MLDNHNEIIIIWMFVKSPEMRTLLNFVKDIIVIPFGTKGNLLKLNFLEPPPGIDVMDWLNIIVDILI